jgi:hypothetical protein
MRWKDDFVGGHSFFQSAMLSFAWETKENHENTNRDTSNSLDIRMHTSTHRVSTARTSHFTTEVTEENVLYWQVRVIFSGALITVVAMLRRRALSSQINTPADRFIIDDIASSREMWRDGTRLENEFANVMQKIPKLLKERGNA